MQTPIKLTRESLTKVYNGFIHIPGLYPSEKITLEEYIKDYERRFHLPNFEQILVKTFTIPLENTYDTEYVNDNNRLITIIKLVNTSYAKLIAINNLMQHNLKYISSLSKNEHIQQMREGLILMKDFPRLRLEIPFEYNKEFYTEEVWNKYYSFVNSLIDQIDKLE